MSERKVLNKYYPPDFNPDDLPRLRRPKNFSYKVRLMAPFSMRCNTCGDYIYKGKKFNASKEDAIGEKYLDIQIFRFGIRCPTCSAEITFKTDPENTDYVCEKGASRNFEPWREQAKEQEETKKEKEQEEENNPMKALENRTEASKKEIQGMDALDEIRTINALKEGVDLDKIILNYIEESQKDPDAEEDEQEIRSLASTVRRIEEDEEEEKPKEKPSFFSKKRAPTDSLLSQTPPPKKPFLGGLKKKEKGESSIPDEQTQAKASSLPNSLPIDYPSDDNDDGGDENGAKEA